MSKIFRLCVMFCVLLMSSVTGQNLPACDSLTINCCTLNNGGPNTISLTAENYSSVLFDYPSFVLFDTNMDTVAIETVNYFGIGSGPQLHTMSLVTPITLPFTGFLNLYMLFNDSLACSFPISIPDTTSGILFVSDNHPSFAIIPNPVRNETLIKLATNGPILGDAILKIISLHGRLVQTRFLRVSADGTTELDIRNLISGIYFIQLEQNGVIFSEKLVKL